jgi:hypothetical protein
MEADTDQVFERGGVNLVFDFFDTLQNSHLIFLL